MGGPPARRWLVRLGSTLLVGAMVAIAAPDARADSSPDGSEGPGTLIVGGGNATQVYPFMVSLQRGGGHFCGGSLISSRWVVTARHCVSAANFQMRVGSTNRSSGGTLVNAVRVVRHPTSDLALVQTDRAVTGRTPITIAAATAVGQATRIIGWGQTCAAPGACGAPQILQELNTSLVADARCAGGGIRGATEICVNNARGNSGACYGDSGGPSVTRSGAAWVLTGATSRSGGGSRCAVNPAIYVDVPAHRAWIRTNSGV